MKVCDNCGNTNMKEYIINHVSTSEHRIGIVDLCTNCKKELETEIKEVIACYKNMEVSDV